MRMPKQTTIPVTILTGFLGAGKTTLLNQLLEEMEEQKVAVIINEWEETSIDSHLVRATREEIIEINNGCICCNVRGDLIRQLAELLKQRIDHVIIETTGLANPAPVIQTFLMDEQTATTFAIDSVMTMIDAKHIWKHLADVEVGQQIAFADRIIINKMDLITTDQAQSIEQQLITMNPYAKRFFTTYADLDMRGWIGTKSFDLDHALQMEPDLFRERHHHNTNQVTSFVLREERPFDLDKLNNWFAYLVQVKGEQLYRYKGILYLKQSDKKVCFQGVHMVFAGTEGERWLPQETRQSELVFIGHNLNQQELETGFQYCLA